MPFLSVNPKHRRRRNFFRSRAFTLMFVPHSGKKARRLRLPSWAPQVLAIIMLTFLGGLSWFGVDYMRLRAETQELARLKTENYQQARQIEELAQEAVSVQQRLEEIDDLDNQVRQMMGLPSRDQEDLPNRGRQDLPPRGGPGRRVTAADIRQTLQDAGDSIDPTKEKLVQLKEDVANEQRRLAHIPNGWPVRGTITSRFGTRRSPYGRKTEFHEGIDIAAPNGTAIKATGAGIVVYAGWHSGYGRKVIIDHGYGYQTCYAHNSKIKVKVGTKVKRGDVIAFVGSTGRSTGPHLHYEVIYQGVKKNPANYL